MSISTTAAQALQSQGDDMPDMTWPAGGAIEMPATQSPLAGFCELADLLVMKLPTRQLMKRFAEAMSDTLGCRFCGLAMRTSNDDSVALNLSSRSPGGQRTAWLPLDSGNANGGPVTLYVCSKGMTLVVDEFKKLPADLYDATLIREGVASGVVVPMQKGQTDYGTLGVYHDTPREFTADEVRFVESARDLLLSAIERSFLEGNLNNSGRLHESMLQSMQSLFVLMGADGLVLDANLAMNLASGFEREDVVGRSFVGLFAHKNDSNEVAAAIKQADVAPVKKECRMPTKNGETRHIAWTFSMVDPTSDCRQYLATGIDITRQTAAVERADRADHEVRSINESLAALRTIIGTGEIAQIRKALGELDKQLDKSSGNNASSRFGSASRRATVRREFRKQQRVAPIIDGKIPEPHDFITVSCVDLSVGGISFLLPSASTAREYLIALGTSENALHLKAEVRNSRLIEEDGGFLFRVGCRFVDRVQAITKDD